MKKFLPLFFLFLMTGCDLDQLWYDMREQIVHNKTGKKFTFKYNNQFQFTIEKDGVIKNKAQGRSVFQWPIEKISGKKTFDFEDGKILEAEVPSTEYPDIYSIISKENIVVTKGGGSRVYETVNYYITEEVYKKAK